MSDQEEHIRIGTAMKRLLQHDGSFVNVLESSGRFYWPLIEPVYGRVLILDHDTLLGLLKEAVERFYPEASICLGQQEDERIGTLLIKLLEPDARSSAPHTVGVRNVGGRFYGSVLETVYGHKHTLHNDTLVGLLEESVETFRIRREASELERTNSLKTVDLDRVVDEEKCVFEGVVWKDVQEGKTRMVRNGETLIKVEWIPQTMGECVWIKYDNGETYSFAIHGDSKEEYYGEVPTTTLVVHRR